MTLRTKLLLGYAGFVLALGLLGAWSARTLNQMSAVSGHIIAENYDSVVAAQDMKESLERQDSAALFDLLGQRERARQQAAEHRRRFDAALAAASANITEPGERDDVEAIRRGRDEYYRRFDAFTQTAGDRTTVYFQSLEPQFNQVRAGADSLLRLNQEAMRRKADAASRIARRWFFVTLGLALVLMAAGVAIELSLSRAIVGPVAQLTAATARLASGDLETPPVPVRSADEIGTLAVSFNRMADRLRELRRSDMGKLLIAQQTTEAVIDSLFDPVVVADGEGLVARLNPAAERLFGAKANALGRPISAVTRDPRITQSVADVLSSHAPAASEDAAATLPWAVDGARRAFRIRSTPMKDPDGRLVGVVTLLEDVTHLSEVSRVKSEFIAAASHELRTPLTSVQMGIHLLLEGSAGRSERQRDILQVCREDTTRLDRLMRELLDLSKIESGAVTPQMAPVRPVTLVGEAIEPLRLQVEARGIRLEVDAPPDLPHVSVDRGQIERVITNLVSNAMRATADGGSITVAAVRRSDEVAVSVTDTGSGIPREYLATIFEPFVQVPHATAGGAGLGLTISRRIVEGHDGRLSVQSEPGRGSTFTFTIPLASERQDR
jgi:PAS domain S-box-containing protein